MCLRRARCHQVIDARLLPLQASAFSQGALRHPFQIRDALCVSGCRMQSQLWVQPKFPLHSPGK